MRIYIIGCSGAGKTSLAKKLSSITGVMHSDLDDVYWERKYDIKNEIETINKKLESIMRQESWIIEGSYFEEWVKKIAELSDIIIYLDIPYCCVVYRVFKRHCERKLKKSGESFWDIIIMIRYAINAKRQKCYEKHLGEFSNKVLTLKTYLGGL